MEQHSSSFNSVKQLADGGYIAGGQGNNGGNGLDQYLVRTNSSGDTTWTKRFGTLGTDNIEYIHPVADGFPLAAERMVPAPTATTAISSRPI